MRGLPGILIAAGLGIVGAFCNWWYLARQASQLEAVQFLALDTTAQINFGDKFRESHFVPVNIPRNNLGNLDQAAVHWRDRNAVVGRAATRAYLGGEILLWQDLVTPSDQDLSSKLAKNEVARTVPVDSRSFVPELVNPGDLVSFVIPQFAGAADPGNSNQPRPGVSSSKVIGPFRILSLGARMGSRNVRRANDRSSGQEHLITIGVKFEEGKLEPRAEELFQTLAATNNTPVQVMLLSAELKDQPLP